MKTMTCKELGGPCDHKIMGNTPKEMMRNGELHMQQEHPEVANTMKAMSQMDNQDWTDDFMFKWNRIPDMK